MPSKADIIEALLFASEKPLTVERLAQIAELKPREVSEEIEVLREEKNRIGGLQLVEVASGWQMVTKAPLAPFVRRLREAPRQRLSRAAFEVLSVVAYRQPITRGEIDGLRGVDSAAPVGFLLEKKLLNFAGRKETPGRPWLYVTTPQFLEIFGLRSLDDLPPLEELEALNNGMAAADGGATQELFNRGRMRPIEEQATLTVAPDVIAEVPVEAETGGDARPEPVAAEPVENAGAGESG